MYKNLYFIYNCEISTSPKRNLKVFFLKKKSKEITVFLDSKKYLNFINLHPIL
jgi:hypothetical protein